MFTFAPSTRRGVRVPTARRGGVLTRLVVLLVVLGGVAGGAAWALRDGGEQGVGDRDVATAQVMSFTISTQSNGDLQARRQTEVRNPLESQATITEVIDEGRRVKKGDVLVRLATDELERKLLEAERNLSSATNAFIVAENALEIQESDNDSELREATLAVELAELELEKWRDGDVREKRQELKLALDKAERELDRLTKKLKLSEELRAKDFISEDELEQDQIAKVEAESNLKTAQIRREVYEKFTFVKDEKQKTSDVEEAKAKLQRVKSRNATRLKTKQADVEYNKSLVAKRQEEYDKVRGQLDASVITAPTDGLVVYSSSTQPDWRWDDRGPLEVGRNVWPNETLIVLPDTSEMMSVVKIHESLVSKVRIGQRALVTVDALNGKVFEGALDSIGVLAQGGGWRDPNNREYEIKIALSQDEDQTGLKPSMRCEAEIVLDEAVDVLAVPVQAVFAEGDVSYVYSPSPGGERFLRRPIATGRRSNEHAEVLAGLGDGAEVLLRRPRPSEVVQGPFDEAAVAAAQEREAEYRAAQMAAAEAAAKAGRPEAPPTPGQGDAVADPALEQAAADAGDDAEDGGDVAAAANETDDAAAASTDAASDTAEDDDAEAVKARVDDAAAAAPAAGSD